MPKISEEPIMEKTETKQVLKILKDKKVRGLKDKLYLVRYKNPIHEDEWLPEEHIENSEKCLRRFKHSRDVVKS